MIRALIPAVCVLLPLLGSGCAVAVRPQAPPLRVEAKPARPHARAVWIAGHWKWNRWRRRYVWVPGHWQVRRPLPPVRRRYR